MIKDPCPTCEKPLLRDALGFIVVAGANPAMHCPDPRGHGAITSNKIEIGFKLERPPEQTSFRVLHCDNCGNDTNFEITLADNGQWSIECLACNDSAVLLSELINNLK